VRPAAATVLASLALLAGCGSEEPDTPGPCLAEADAYLAALERAPGPVTLDGDVAISDCLIDSQPSGELAQIGTATVEAATRLSARARQGDGPAAIQLGYLVGAVQRGAAETGGIHTDLVRRLESAAQTGPAGGLTGAADVVYRRGLAAGRRTG
jgi:hypothetical protein